MKTNKTNSTVSTNNVINALEQLRRGACKELLGAACTLNQAIKVFRDLEKSHGDAFQAIGWEKATLKALKEAWAPELRIDGSLALYCNERQTVTDENDKEVALYERKVNKKGAVSFSAVSIKKLTIPEKWTPALVLEGLAQSRQLELAKLEAEVSEMHYANLVRKGELYTKTSAAETEGNTVTTTATYTKVAAEEAEADVTVTVTTTNEKAA